MLLGGEGGMIEVVGVRLWDWGGGGKGEERENRGRREGRGGVERKGCWLVMIILVMVGW